MSKVYVYTRNSTLDAFEKGSSRETQIKKCNNYAQIKDLEIDEIIEEQCSGTIPFERRDVAFELLKKLKTNDHIICSHLDRFCRNTLSLLQMIQRFKRRRNDKYQKTHRRGHPREIEANIAYGYGSHYGFCANGGLHVGGC